MKQIPQSLRRMASRVLSRRGSMLIMVIVILVLLALIGTAMISTSRIDRLGTQQNAVNTQIDLLVESVKNMAKAAITSGVYGTTAAKPFRPAGLPVTTGYNNWDSVGLSTTTDNDHFLASRIPVYDGTTVGWPFISQWLVNANFESPRTPFPGPGSPSYNTRNAMIPTSISVINSTGTQAFPAFTIGGNTYLAADADGDGIADAGLFRLPVGDLNGVTYFAAVRIIDNNSAINASTAWSNTADFNFAATPAATTNYGMFPSNVGLLELLKDFNAGGTYTTVSPEMTLYNQYRFNTTAANPTAADTSSPAWPITDAGTQRTDFNYFSQGQSLQSQLARRLTNPGHRTATLSYQPPLSDASALAYKFLLANPNASPSIIESVSTGMPGSYYPYNAVTTKGHLQVRTSGYYGPGNYLGWANDNFDWDNLYNGYSIPRPLRSITVTKNGVSNQMSQHSMAGMDANYKTTIALNASDKMPDYTTTPGAVAKVSINTAPFNILWRGFWNVMVDNDATNAIPPNPVTNTAVAPTAVGWGMFRSPLRDMQATPLNIMTSQEVMMLRSAIAAVNTLDLRATDYNDFSVSSRRVQIYDSTAPATAKYEAMIFGTKPQPYITEVYANTDNVNNFSTGVNPKGYVAVELYNPYPYAISLKFWNLGIIQRAQPVGTGTGIYPRLKYSAITGFSDSAVNNGFGGLTTVPVIAPHSYITLENYGATAPSGNDALSRPPEMATTPPVNPVYVKNLQRVLTDPTDATAGGELVLLRPRRMKYTAGTSTTAPLLACDALSKCTVAANLFDEGTAAAENLYDMVPADQFDFTNLAIPSNPMLATDGFYAIHYVRGNTNGAAAAPTQPNWKFVFPGTYTAGAVAPTLRQEVVTQKTAPWGNIPAGQVPTDPWITTPPAAPGIAFGTGDTQSTYVNTFSPIQLANVDFAGFNQCTTGATTPNMFPFGGFARNADMLKVPFIGAYRIRLLTGTNASVLANKEFEEMNSVTMDSTLADDQNAVDDTTEATGRFCPIKSLDPAYTVLSPDTDGYAWASDFFDYFSVQSPNDDYFPNVDPLAADEGVTGFNFTLTPLVTKKVNRYPGATAPTPVANANGTANVSEDTVPVEGLININTASWKVISALPLIPNGTPAQNKTMAKLIVDWRDGTGQWAGFIHGPFKTIYDLNRVAMQLGATGTPDPANTFQNALGALPFTTTDPDDAAGDLSPYDPNRVLPTPAGSPRLGTLNAPAALAEATADGVRLDFEERFLNFARVSNLITTRSDTFTVYVLVQGWRNCGTTSPELVVQRRAAIIVDRNALTTSNTGPAGSLSVTNVPTD